MPPAATIVTLEPPQETKFRLQEGGEENKPPDKMLGATAFGNLLASKVVEVFATRAGRLHKGCCELAWKAPHKVGEAS